MAATLRLPSSVITQDAPRAVTPQGTGKFWRACQQVEPQTERCEVAEGAVDRGKTACRADIVHAQVKLLLLAEQAGRPHTYLEHQSKAGKGT